MAAKGSALRSGLGILSWVLLAGSLLFLWFVVLSAVTSHTPLDKIYFLRADTSAIQGARPISQWNFFYISGNGNQNRGSATAAIPFGYAWRGGGEGAPPELLGNHGNGTTSQYYYYMWRFGWVFYFLAFIFANFALFTGLVSCLRIGAVLSAFFAFFATFWMTLAACLMTAVFVKARNVFQNDGRDASVGPYAFGFTWAALCLLFLSSILFTAGALVGKREHRHGPPKDGQPMHKEKHENKEGSYLAGFREGPKETYVQGNGPGLVMGKDGYVQPTGVRDSYVTNSGNREQYTQSQMPRSNYAPTPAQNVQYIPVTPVTLPVSAANTPGIAPMGQQMPVQAAPVQQMPAAHMPQGQVPAGKQGTEDPSLFQANRAVRT